MYQSLIGGIALRLRGLVRQTYEAFEIEIITGVFSNDSGLYSSYEEKNLIIFSIQYRLLI